MLTHAQVTEAANTAAVGTDWAVHLVQDIQVPQRDGSKADAFEVTFHDSKKGLYVCAIALVEASEEALVTALVGAVAQQAPFPDWKPGEPIPQLTVKVLSSISYVPADAHPIFEYEVGMPLVVTMVDYDQDILTVRPKYGPWERAS